MRYELTMLRKPNSFEENRDESVRERMIPHSFDARAYVRAAFIRGVRQDISISSVCTKFSSQIVDFSLKFEKKI